MNLLSHLPDHELLVNTKNLVAEEKRITQEVLSHLEEIESRKLYLARGFSSLFDYCIKELNYSQSATYRRISAMRLIKSIPEAKEKLSLGSVSLSTLTQPHRFLKKEEKEKSYSNEMKLDLLEKIEGKSQDQCEREFIKISPEINSFKEREKLLTEELTQYTFTATRELKAKLDQLKSLVAHKNPNPGMAELIEIIADASLEKFNLLQKKVTGNSAQVKVTSAAVSHHVKPEEKKARLDRKLKVKADSGGSRNIPARIRRFVWKRDQGVCQYKDKETNKKCESNYAIQIDHIHPYSLGGSHEESNLRLLCRNHNQWRTRDLYKH